MDKEFFMNLGLQYDPSFSSSTMPTWESMEIQNNHSHDDYFISTQPQNDHFESTLTSIVSSPTSNSAISTDNFMIRELIGKLGNICSSNGVQNYVNNGNCSSNNSCYNTPLSSPPKLGMSLPNIDHQNFPFIESSNELTSTLPAVSVDPGFAARAARFSSFGSKSFNCRTTNDQFGVLNNSNANMNGGFVNGKLQRVLSSPLLKVDTRSQINTSNNNSMNEKHVELENYGNDQNELCKVQEKENSSISSQNQAKENGSTRKRKASLSKGKEKELSTNSNKICEKPDDSKRKRSRSQECNEEDGDEAKTEEEKGVGDGKNNKQKSVDSTKDYIHVRARRGQATDSHSLAERVRREKIGERMKLLQDLVPGCNKVTGKALMLDEIINYVQSLQRQVEFLSMKLSTVNPRLEMNMCNLFTKDGNQPNMEHPMYQTNAPTQYGVSSHQNPLQDSNVTTARDIVSSCSMEPFNPTINTTNHHALHLPSIHGFSNYLSQLPSLCEGELQSIVNQMGFGQKENGFEGQTLLHGPNSSQMKLEF